MIEFIAARWSFPSLAVWAMYFPLGLIAGSISGLLVGYSKQRFQIKIGYTRKIFHFIIFSLAGLVGIAGGFEAVQVYGTAVAVVVIAAVLRRDRSLLFRAIARPSDAPYKRFYILVPLLMTACGGMLSNVFFGPCAIIGYISAGWGDAIAEPVGTRWGNHRYRVLTVTGIKAYRSLEGSAAVFLATFAGTMLVLLLSRNTLSAEAWLLCSFAVASISALVEALSPHGFDNLTIQVGTSGIGCYMLERILSG